MPDFLALPLQCEGSTCEVFKLSRCLVCDTKVFDDSGFRVLADKNDKQDFVECALQLIAEYGSSESDLPSANKCSDEQALSVNREAMSS